MVIERNVYLDKLISKKHNGLIKVITGMRNTVMQLLLCRTSGNDAWSHGI